MTTDAVPGLSPLESDIMSVLWDAAEGMPACEVCDRLGCPAAATCPAAVAVLKTLCGSGLATRDRHGRLWYYRPSRSRDEHLAALIRGALAAATRRDAVLRLALRQDASPSFR